MEAEIPKQDLRTVGFRESGAGDYDIAAASDPIERQSFYRLFFPMLRTWPLGLEAMFKLL